VTTAKRSTPDDVLRLVAVLATERPLVTVPAIVETVRRETGCSRATAYRAVTDAIIAGCIRRVGG
jgi:hypothetical protein